MVDQWLVSGPWVFWDLWPCFAKGQAAWPGFVSERCLTCLVIVIFVCLRPGARSRYKGGSVRLSRRGRGLACQWQTDEQTGLEHHTDSESTDGQADQGLGGRTTGNGARPRTAFPFPFHTR